MIHGERLCAQNTLKVFLTKRIGSLCEQCVCVCSVCVVQEFIMCRHSNRGGHYMSEIWEENNSFLKNIKADECMKRTVTHTCAREHTTNALIVSLSHMLHISVINIRSLIVTYLQIYYFKPSTSSPNDCFHLQASSSTSPFNSTNLNANRQLLIR